ncbi:hypothetical protein N8Z27_01465 [Crocinitomicaceae bacterium]|nr:hypothetical protein [Crocinitomicaceae bacterium]
MEVLSFDLKLSEIIPFDSAEFKDEPTFIWVWHADKVPPHIGISTSGKYFSLKSNGKDEAVDVFKVTELVERKNIKTLLFELHDHLEIEEIAVVFKRYTTTSTNEVTCLKPLKAILNCPDARMLKDLLAELKAVDRIAKVIGFNIDATFKGIQDYKVEDIHNRLRKLEND